MPASSADDPTTTHKKLSHQLLWNAAAFILAAILIVFLVRAADWNAVAEQVRHAQLSILLFVWFVLGSISCLLRATRWYALLSAERQIGFWPVFWANSSGNFGNSVLPARAGEFVRAAMVSERSGLSKRFVFAVGLCERVFDMLVLIVLTRLGLRYVSVLPEAVQRAISAAFWIALGAVAFLLIISQSHRVSDVVFSSRLRPTGTGRIWRSMQPFVDGIRSIHNRKRLLLFAVLTVPIWLVDAWGATLVAVSLRLALPFPVALILLAAISCSSLIPATPGQLGIFQFVTVRVLAICQIQYNQALTYSLILQASTYLVLTIWGIPGLWMYKKRRTLPERPPLNSTATPDSAQRAVTR